MLRFLRKYSRSTGVKILYGVLAALFVVWGVGAIGGEQVDVVARVHGERISRRELDRATVALERRYAEMRLPAELLRSVDLHQQALDQLIDQALMRHAAAELGIGVSDAEVVDFITRMPELQEGGRFARERLEAFLESQRDRGEFEAQIRTGLLAERLQALVVDGVAVSDAEVEERYRFDRTQVSLAFARVAAAELAKAVTLSDEELQKYLDEHAQRYTVPTQVRARYVAFRPAAFAGEVTPTDGEIAEYYELHKEERFTRQEEVRASHVLVRVDPTADEATKTAARKKAEGILAEVKGGADFAALARKNSDDPGSAAKGGDLGFFPRGRMTPAFEAAAFALQPGQVSDIVETPFGFHIIEVGERREAGAEPLEAVRDAVVEALRQERSLELARKAAEAVRGAVVRGTSFAEAVGGHALAETPPFAAGAPIPEVGRVEDFSEAAFALADGEVSDLVETEDAIYLLTPFGREESHVPPLAEAREGVLADAQRERGQAAAKERAEKLLARAREIGLGEAAPEAGLAVEETGLFDRRAASIPKLGAVPDLRTDALALTSEAPLAPKVYVTAGDAVVAALKERTPPDMSELADAKADLSERLLREKQQAALAAYRDYLKQRAARAGALEVRADTGARG